MGNQLIKAHEPTVSELVTRIFLPGSDSESKAT